MKVEKEICELCNKEYVPHHNPTFRTELCKGCEEDVMYAEEVKEYQETITREMAMDAGDPDLEGQTY